MPRVRRSPVILLVIAAVLGVFTTIVVCWTVALSVDIWVGYRLAARYLHPGREMQGELSMSRIDAFGSTFTEANVWDEGAVNNEVNIGQSPETLVASIGLSRAIPWGQSDRPWRLYDRQCIEARGWPLRCAWCRVLPIDNTSGASAIPTGTRSGSRRFARPR